MNEKWQQVIFEKDDLMFLRVGDSKSLSTGPVPKLSPRYCRPFWILKQCVGNVAYKLELPEKSKVHLVFHVSHLRKWLHAGGNVVDTGVLVEYTKPPMEPHELERILDHHELFTCHHIYKQVLVKWKDQLDKGSTWENASTLHKRFPQFIFKDKNSFKRGE